MTVIEVLDITNPWTQQTIAEIGAASPGALSESIALSRRAQREWAKVPMYRRARQTLEWSARVRESAEELAELLATETGKPLTQAREEVSICARLLERFANLTYSDRSRAFHLDIQEGLEHDVYLTRREPLGVVVAVTPFNFPLELLAHKVAPAILTGSAVIVKPSEKAPLAAARVIEMVTDLDVPKGLVQVVHGGPAAVQQLVQSADVDCVSFTGSTRAGFAVMGYAAGTVKRVILELGGNDAMIVLEDADLDLVVDHAVAGRTLANGQCCSANKRLIVTEAVADQLVEALVAKFGSIAPSDPLNPSTRLGPLIDVLAASSVITTVDQAVAAGARLLTGGTAEMTVVAPVVLDHVPREASIACDAEVFGPVLPVIRVRDVQEAIDVHNQSSFGLSGSVFTRDLGRGYGVACQLRTGQVVLNGSGAYRPDATPYGGVARSGIGRESLSTSFDEYSALKGIALRNVSMASTGEWQAP